jgi:hypothetical protein
LNSPIACSFSLLSGKVSTISNARLIMTSSAVRYTWYCSGKCSVTYSLIYSLAWLRKYCMSELIEASDTCYLYLTQTSGSHFNYLRPTPFYLFIFGAQSPGFFLVNITLSSFLALSNHCIEVTTACRV